MKSGCCCAALDDRTGGGSPGGGTERPSAAELISDPAHLERRKAAHDAALKRIAADPKMQATRQAARASSFLGTAKSRLLPASMPFRFFGAATLFHLLFWLLLLLDPAAATGFVSGLGPPLAALHSLTLGTLAMTAIGASLQLLPVATRQPIGSTRWIVLLWWLYLPSLLLLLAGMALPQVTLLALGAVGVTLGLVVYLVLLARNLAGARGMPVVLVHGWLALAALAVLLLAALSMVGGYAGWPLVLDRARALPLHVAYAGYGFMVMLVMGFSAILVPMFALSPPPATRLALVGAGLGAAALLLVWLALPESASPWWWVLACVLALAGFAIHVTQMRRCLAQGMRKELGSSFVLVKLGWALIAASLAVAALQAAGHALPALGALLAWLPVTLAALLLMLGLLSVLTGVLSRILPFLASMHAPAGKRGPPVPSSLTAAGPQRWHAWAHPLACALLLVATWTGQAWLMALAALAGATGALAFVAFFAHAWRRMRPPAKTTAAPAA